MLGPNAFEMALIFCGKVNNHRRKYGTANSSRTCSITDARDCVSAIGMKARDGDGRIFFQHMTHALPRRTSGSEMTVWVLHVAYEVLLLQREEGKRF